MELFKNLAGILVAVVALTGISAQICADVELAPILQISLENGSDEDILVTAPDGTRQLISSRAHSARRGTKAVSAVFEYDPASKSLLLTAETLNPKDDVATKGLIFRVRPGDKKFKFSIDGDNLVVTKVK